MASLYLYHKRHRLCHNLCVHANQAVRWKQTAYHEAGTSSEELLFFKKLKWCKIEAKLKWKWNKLALIWFDAAIQIRNTSVSSFSLTEQSDFFLLTKYRISSVLFSPLDRKHPHCFMHWVPMIFLKCNLPTWQWPFSAFFIEVSQYTSKPISICLASERDVKAYFSNPSAN